MASTLGEIVGAIICLALILPIPLIIISVFKVMK